MKNFQKIKSIDNEINFERKILTSKGKSSLKTIEQGDGLVVTEKIDGSNAQVRNHNGKLYVYSHKTVLNENRTLNGFYNFVMERKEQLLKLIPEGYSFFGEWLTPHRIKYPRKAYNRWYLFDIFKFDPIKEKVESDSLTNEGRYLGINQVQALFYYLNTKYLSPSDPFGSWVVSNSFGEYEDGGIVIRQPLVPDVYAVPIYHNLKGYYKQYGAPTSLRDLDILREYLSNESVIPANEDKEEGIVVTDTSKIVPIDDQSTGYLRVKCVNEAFKEMRHNKLPLGVGEKAALEWANKYITEPRVQKQILELQDSDKLPKELSFDWFKNGLVNKISKVVLKDALEESTNDIPDALTTISPSYDKNIERVTHFSNKITNKVIALTIKGMI